MAKRIADKELTDRNWDQEDDEEEYRDAVCQAGTFSMATDDVLKNRPIKKAKRRTTGTEGDSGGAFKVFKGFSLAPSSATGPATGSAFSGFGNGAGFKGLSGLPNGTGSTPVTPAFQGFSALAANRTPTSGSLTFNGPSSSADITGKPQPNGSAPIPSVSQSTGGTNSKEYSRQLTALNCSVRDWITKHVNGNPLCDLNPIFRDYERHLASIEKKYGGGAGGLDGGAANSHAAALGEKPPTSTLPPSSSSSSVSSVAIATAAPALFSFSKQDSPAAVPENSTPAPVGFCFGQKVDSSVLGSLASRGAPPSFSFSSTSSTTSVFGGTAPPSFSFNGAEATATKTTDENGEEPEEPPKVEVKEVKEKDAFYSKKCKLFYKKDTEFKEKGVGTLHLKTTAEGKIQLLVRADTNLGNILLNIMVQASMPCSRMGKNNVMVVCVPNPAVDEQKPGSPVPMLIRVKTAQDADELHQILEDKKA